MTNRHARTVCTLLLAAIILSPQARAEIVEAIVATVDDEIILRSDVLLEAQAPLVELRDSAASQQEFDRQIRALPFRRSDRRGESAGGRDRARGGGR